MTFADHSQAPGYQTQQTGPNLSRTNSTGAILLAAGFSRRFGGIKLEARLSDGSTLLQQCFNNVLQATENIIVVGRQELLQSGIYNFLPKQTGIQLLICPDAESGMGHSLAFAIKDIPQTWRSTLVCLGDMPFIKTETLKAIMAASSENNIVIPVWQSQRGHPVSFGRRYFKDLADSQGDTGGRNVIKQYPQHIKELQTDDVGVVQDIDTPEALALLTQSR